jgi:uncharacterized protein (TIGR02302 family)
MRGGLFGQDTQSRLDRRIVLTWLAAFWEDLWPRLWLPLSILGIFVAISWLDLWVLMPGYLHLALLGVFGVGLAATLIWKFRGVSRPADDDVKRRLERDSDLAHRPLTAVEDELATGFGDAESRRLWQTHQRRMRERLDALRVKAPKAGWGRQDHYGLRAVVAMALFIAIMAAGGDANHRLARAFSPDLSPPKAPASQLDAWINPPAYTGLAPIFLSGNRATDGVTALKVPTGSQILARLFGGAGTAELTAGGTTVPFKALDRQNQEIEATVTDGERLTIRQSEAVVADWPMQVIPDHAPSVVMAEKPKATVRGVMLLSYEASDDYGIAAVTARFRRPGDTTELDVELPLPELKPRALHASNYHDLTEHPWAGLEVTLVVAAIDDLGQTGTSTEMKLILPERRFTHPVARALIEQRKRLTVDPESRDKVAQALGAISEIPESFDDDLTAYLAMRSAEARLRHDRSPKAIEEVQSMLWETARRIEDGGLPLAERELRRLQDALMEALNKGASDQEIERLMDALKSAINDFLKALMEQAQRQAEQGDEMSEADPEAQKLDAQRLQEMLDRARELSRSGARQAAKDMLAQLRNMLENLKTARMSPNAEQRRGRELLDELSNMMRDQQKLMDETFRQSQKGRRQGRAGRSPYREPGQGDGRRASPHRSPNSMPFDSGRMSQEQEALRRQLGDLMRRLGEDFGNIPSPLGRAERSMREARERLEQGQMGHAVGPQGNAMDQMRQGARKMMEELVQRLGEPGTQGDAEFGALGRNDDQDPLGRPVGAQWDYGESVKVPEDMDLQESREILDELRRRSGQRSRPKPELDYLDRLMKRF